MLLIYYPCNFIFSIPGVSLCNALQVTSHKARTISVTLGSYWLTGAHHASSYWVAHPIPKRNRHYGNTRLDVLCLWPMRVGGRRLVIDVKSGPRTDVRRATAVARKTRMWRGLDQCAATEMLWLCSWSKDAVWALNDCEGVFFSLISWFAVHASRVTRD